MLVFLQFINILHIDILNTKIIAFKTDVKCNFLLSKSNLTKYQQYYMRYKILLASLEKTLQSKSIKNPKKTCNFKKISLNLQPEAFDS